MKNYLLYGFLATSLCVVTIAQAVTKSIEGQIESLKSFTSDSPSREVLVVKLTTGEMCQGKTDYALPTGDGKNQTTVALLTAAFLNGRGVWLELEDGGSLLADRCRIRVVRVK